MPRRRVWSALLLLLPLLSITSPTRADLKVVMRMTMPGPTLDGKDELRPQTIVIYYKNDKIRTEIGGATSVLIQDTSRDTTVSLDPRAKTYVTLSSPAAAAAAPNGFLSLVSLSAKVFSKPGRETRVIAGQPATRQRHTAFITVRPRPGAAGALPGMAALLPRITIEVEQWIANAIPLPASLRKTIAAGGLAGGPLTSPLLREGMKPLLDKLSQIKGLPLASTTTTTITMPAEAGSLGADQLPRAPLIVTTEVIEISENALADDLFVVPADYKPVETAPSTSVP